MRLVIGWPAKSIPDLILFFDDVQRQPDTNAREHENGPLPSKRIDCHTLSTQLASCFTQTKLDHK